MEVGMTPPPTTLQLELFAPPLCVAGFPCSIAVELRNPASAAGGAIVPALSDLGPPTQIRASWRTAEGVVARVEAVPPGYEEGGALRVSFAPGTARRMLVDVQELLALPLGAGELEIDYEIAKAKARVRFAVVAPSAADSRFAALLPAGRSWRSALLSGAIDPRECAELSTAARESLALYLAYAAAVRGESLAVLPTEPFAALPWPLDAEAHAFIYELERAREDPRAGSSRRALVQRWPGLVWRADRVDAGHGALKVLRDIYGARAPVNSPRPSGP
jgi:hypothetical protein